MKKALLIVDIQNDFLPGGSFAVKEGDRVIPLVNKLVKGNFGVIVASKDWHPGDHGSFAKTHGKNPGEKIQLKGMEQILWPVHCVQNTLGGEFSSLLDASNFKKIFFKGTDKGIDSYSAFFDNGHLKSTGLSEYLKNLGVTDVYIAGLTTDYCIRFSALDALKQGFKVHVIIDACRAINLEAGDGEKAIEEMKKAGAEITTTDEVMGISG